MARPDSPLLDTKGANKGYPNLYGKADDVRGKTIICPPLHRPNISLPNGLPPTA